MFSFPFYEEIAYAQLSPDSKIVAGSFSTQPVNGFCERPWASSSSSTTPVRPWDYEVFFSFTSVDTRYSFIAHLYATLDRKGIVAFIDEGLERGEEIASSLVTVIKKSRCALVILSKNYAHSKWCLKELTKIMECRVEMGQIVYPVFYHVDPSDVRNQRGSYGAALAKHERNGLGHQTQRWRAVLTEVIG